MYKDHYENAGLKDEREKRLDIAAKSSDIDQLRAEHLTWDDIAAAFKEARTFTPAKSLYSIIAIYADQPVRDYVFNEMILPFFSEFKTREDITTTFTYLDLESWNILQYAAAFNQVNFIKNLKNKGLIGANELNTLPKYLTTQTPLQFAAFSGHLEMVKLLLSLGSIPAAPAQGLTISALHLAIAGRHLNVARYLMGTDSVNRALIYSAISGNADIVRSLLREGAEIDTQDNTGETSLFYAAKKGHYKAFKILFEADADFTLPNEKGDTPLSCAVVNKDYRMVQHFIPFKKAFERDAVILTLKKAFINNDRKMLDLLLSPALGLDIQNDLFRKNLMIVAATHGKPEMLSALIEAGHSIHIAHPTTQRPLLLLALLSKNLNVAELFAKAGCVKNTIDSVSNKSTLRYAAFAGSTYIVDQLLKNNHVSQKELDKSLLVAARRGHTSTVKSLILAGANTSRLTRTHSLKIILEIFNAFIHLDQKEPKRIHQDFCLEAIINLPMIKKFELDKYIIKTANREENHYKRKFTLFGKTINFGYSSTEKLAAATALKLAIEGVDKSILDQHKGALNNGELKTIYRALMRR